jgi:hypothetical protein
VAYFGRFADALRIKLGGRIMTRRQFAFWLGFGLFTLADKLRVWGLDDLAAAAMRATDPKPEPSLATADLPVHWTAAENKTWRWFERENFVDGKWKLTGITTPVHKKTGKPKEGAGYLDESLVPPAVRRGEQSETIELSPELAAEFERHRPHPQRKSRHGRPPSKWLRSLNAAELRIWLKTIRVPEAGVSGMTYWEHLTRDHSFDPAKIEGLTIDEQAKLHAAAHYGY